MKITEEEVRYIAQLANLELSEQAIAQYSRDMEEILTYVDKLNELDTSAVEPMAQVIYEGSETATLRDDAPAPSFDQETALREAPLKGAGHFKVPKVIER
jgi:aspartyl-tRNA(Asn)/glutamyl-tRNA(Gln) amidotransferase subunit C